MNAKAYLNLAVHIHCDEEPFPRVVCVAIHSSPPASLTAGTGEMWANVMTVEDSDYATAARSILECVERVDAFAWMRIWLREGYEAHQGRYELYQKRVRILDGKE